MRHPKRHLRAFLDEELPARRRAAVQTHLSRCAACRCAVEEERRLRSRLRALKVPAPREDLASRIVADSASRPQCAPGPGRGRYAVAIGGILTMVSGFVLAGAYILGSIADEPLSAPQQAHLLAGWNQLAEQRSGGLSAEDVQDLRNAGWSCPELDGLGFTLASARTLQVAGHPAVAMELTRNGETLTVYEQRPREGDTNPEVLHAVSGRPVAEEGFYAVTRTADTAPRVWKDETRPGEAVLSARNVTYTLRSSVPEETLSSVVGELSLSESARLLVPARDPDSGAVDRVLNGLALLSGAGRSL
ncbi:zf-HC2 domain-containing protein [Arthrobacter koreensis]|uniref:zf-HC2 domain-containing protein n=1 Tax=Arthrobacter koreensis TaxID=199136 RepID=UPI002DBA0A0C|nr:zf-HC2 domain-containing protein [Arthrobacter koreensis]MEB7448341.1 zf-HC2 domain-containing protein [Arthrobacter koreensis]